MNYVLLNNIIEWFKGETQTSIVDNIKSIEYSDNYKQITCVTVFSRFIA